LQTDSKAPESVITEKSWPNARGANPGLCSPEHIQAHTFEHNKSRRKKSKTSEGWRVTPIFIDRRFHQMQRVDGGIPLS
jgi:hypothetical protein